MAGDTSTAVAREAAWLSTASGDSLPFLLASAIPPGPWQIISAYTQAAATRTQQTAIYVTHGPGWENLRIANQRTRPRYRFKLDLHWPIRVPGPGAATSIAALEQANFDAAIELLRQRVAGPLGDKSHGGRFLSAAIAPAKGQPDITVITEPADITIRTAKELRASMTYVIDDYETNN